MTEEVGQFGVEVGGVRWEDALYSEDAAIRHFLALAPGRFPIVDSAHLQPESESGLLTLKMEMRSRHVAEGRRLRLTFQGVQRLEVTVEEIAGVSILLEVCPLHGEGQECYEVFNLTEDPPFSLLCKSFEAVLVPATPTHLGSEQ